MAPPRGTSVDEVSRHTPAGGLIFRHDTNPSGISGAHLRVDGVSKSYPDRRVLTDVSFTVADGERAALIGENGTGKSTLLRLVAGLDEPDAGVITLGGSMTDDDAQVALFHQTPPFSLDLTAAQVIENATAPLRSLADEVTAAGEALAKHPDDGDPLHADAAARLDAALAAAERTEVWTLEHRIDELVDGLGIAAIPPDRPMSEVSGGQRARFSLAWVLLRHPHTLLLDEPTNHLDDRGAELLARILRSWGGPVLLASHDRAFLDEAVTDLIDLDPRPLRHRVAARIADASDAGAAHGVTRFTGTFSDHVVARQQEHERWQTQYDDEQAEIKRLQAKVRDDHTVGHHGAAPRTEARGAKKFYSDRNATVVSRRVNDARSTLKRLEAEQVRKPPATLQFNATRTMAAAARRTELPSGPLLTATNVAVPGRLAPTSLSLSAGLRLLVEGPNGSGKSTLLALLDGSLTPETGSITRAPRLRVGRLSQDETPLKDDDISVRASYETRVGPETAAKRPLATFGLIAGRDENRPVADLSVGQRRRLDLAVLLALPPDVLLLDEPTNHLSLLLAEDLERALLDDGGYPGALVIASHDRMLRRRWNGERLALTHPTHSENP